MNRNLKYLEGKAILKKESKSTINQNEIYSKIKYRD